MHKVVIISLGITFTLVTFITIYFIPYFSKKKVKQGKFDLLQFINLFFAPILTIPIIYILTRIILSNPEVIIFSIPKNLFDIVFLLLFYFLAMGMGVHSVSVILQRHMKNLKKHKVWEISEYFHQGFSHSLVLIPAILIIFFLSLLEMNRPNLVPLSGLEIVILAICGIILGVCLGIGSTESGIPHLMFYLFYFLSIVTSLIFIMFKLDFLYFPLTSLLEIIFVFAIITLSIYKYKIKGFPEIVPHYFFED